MYAILFVLDDPQLLDDLLIAWEKAGIRGVTIIDSTGWQRRKMQGRLLGARFDFTALSGTAGRMDNHMTLFVVVENRAIVQKCLEATEEIVGDLDLPNTGILTAWPLEIVKGLPQERDNTES
jgi:hypothetical protein